MALIKGIVQFKNVSFHLLLSILCVLHPCPTQAGRCFLELEPLRCFKFFYLKQIFKIFVLSISWGTPQIFYSIAVATVTFWEGKTCHHLAPAVPSSLAFCAWTCLTPDIRCLWSPDWYPCMPKAGRSASYGVTLGSMQNWKQWVKACCSAPSSWQFRGAFYMILRESQWDQAFVTHSYDLLEDASLFWQSLLSHFNLPSLPSWPPEMTSSSKLTS